MPLFLKTLPIPLSLFLGVNLGASPSFAAPKIPSVPAKAARKSVVPTLSQVLSDISVAIDKPVFWLGASPTPQMLAQVARPARDNTVETLGEWASRWALPQNVVVEATPDALLFRRGNAIKDESGATGTSQFIESERLQLALMESLPDQFLARTPVWENSALAQGYNIDAAQETFPLLLLRASRPDFENRLRALLKIFHVHAKGQREVNGETFNYDLDLDSAPSERLRLSMTAYTAALCRVGESKVLLRFPTSQPCPPSGCFLGQPATPLLQQFTRAEPIPSQLIQSKLGALLSHSFSSNSKRRLVVARNLQEVPLFVAAPRRLKAGDVLRTLEQSLGVSRRPVADLEHLTLASDNYTRRAHLLARRWQMAHGSSPYSYFEAQINRPGWAKIGTLNWPAQHAIVSKFRELHSQNPQAASFSEADLLKKGEVWLARANTLHLLLVEPATDKHPMVPLEHFPITLHSSTPPA